MTTEQQIIVWIVVAVVGAFGAGCSLGATYRTKNPKGRANARRK
jgi:hypothetical protein